MAEEGGTGGGMATASSSSTLLLCGGGRLRFEVELTPNDTTIVSWKKLTKDANKAAAKNTSTADNNEPLVNASASDLAVVPAPDAVPPLDSRVAPPTDPLKGIVAENEGNDAPPGSRFSAVIEKIERLYMGKNSSDEEDLNDVPDDDEYDTEDSFIDDAELDDYFQVDNSAIKHDGFFVNRGKLERVNDEPTALVSEQPKKRRRKDSTKGDNVSKDGNVPNKQLKVSKNEKKKVTTLAEKNPITPSRSITVPTMNNEEVKYQSTVIALGTVVKKPSDSKNITNSSTSKILNDETRVTTTKNIDNQKTGVVKHKKHGSKMKDGSLTPVPQRNNEKGADVLKPQGQLLHNSEDVNKSVSPREKNIVHQQADIKASESAQKPKTATQMVRKEGSSTKPKSTNPLLEKAIRDLEKMVTEIRPPSMFALEAENAAQVKRRMPSEIKQKLAKVARLANATHGKQSKELLSRLMSIVGHLIQIRSLKRNLHNMVVSGLSDKEEKNGKLQQLKKEVDEMVKIRAPLMKPVAVEKQAESSDDFQEPSTKEKVAKSTFTTDDALEDKLCDLYDLFVDGLDEEYTGPHIRKFYVELAELWPKGCMDNHGIKKAICRAKDRRKTLFKRKDQETMKRKKLVPTKTDTITADAGSMGQMQHTPDKLESSAPAKSISSTMPGTNAATARPSAPASDKPKQEKLKGNANNQGTTTVTEVVKKIAKRKAEAELHDSQIRPPEKSNSAQGKQMVSGLVKVATHPQANAVPIPDGGQPKVNSSVDKV